MGVSTAAGVALGLWSCQPRAGRVLDPQMQPPAEPPVPGPAVASAPTDTGIETGNPAVEPSIGDPTAPPPTVVSQPDGPLTAPDLGAEVFPRFPDATVALAHPAEAPVILIPRTDWTSARPRLEQIVPMDGIGRLTVHHTAGVFDTDAWRPTAGNLEGIREFHAGDRPTDQHWADIAYHFAIDRAGRVWQARPLAYQGAHARGHNEHNLGIVLLGNFQVQSPSAAQLTALAAFIGFVRRLYSIPLGQVFTHGELADTECPGRLLQAYMDRARNTW